VNLAYGDLYAITALMAGIIVYFEFNLLNNFNPKKASATNRIDVVQLLINSGASLNL
jgi:hypothetical protein